jgi:hypothetical protein
MQEQDTSREIIETYYSKGKILRIVLKDGAVLEGMLTGFFHGEPDWGEPYILKWRFIPTAAISDRYIPGADKPEGKIIFQRDILEIRFK